MRKFFACIFLLLTLPSAWGAIVFDAASSNAVEGNSVSVSHTATGTDRYAVIAVFQADDHTITSVSYGAQTPTLIAAQGRLSVYGLVAPAGGAQTVTANSSSAGAGIVIGVVSYTGVDQSTPIGTATSDESVELPTTSTIVSSATGNLVVDAAVMIILEMAADAGQTERVSLDDSGVGFFSFGMSEKAGAASVTMGWTATETFGDNPIVAVPLIAATGGANAVPVIYNQLMKSKR